MSKKIEMDKAADSIAAMFIEWVDGGIRMGTDWRAGLASVIQLRLNRIDAQSELAALREERAQYQRLFSRAGDALCTIGEMLGVPENDQSAGTTIQAVVALREELAAQKETVALFGSEYSKQSASLTAAEQRNAELNGLLRELRNTAYTKGGISLAAYIDPHIKPTESGASE